MFETLNTGNTFYKQQTHSNNAVGNKAINTPKISFANYARSEKTKDGLTTQIMSEICSEEEEIQILKVTNYYLQIYTHVVVTFYKKLDFEDFQTFFSLIHNKI